MAHAEPKNKKYDEKGCWNRFMEMGAAYTVRKLNSWHKEKYGFVSHMGVQWAIWRYACKNPETAYDQYKVWNLGFGFRDFLKKCQRIAKGTGNSRRDSILGKRAYRQFCQKYELEE